MGYEKIKDKETRGTVYVEPEFPCIRYLVDGGIYWFGDYRCLAIGGAYSVDKWYRLSCACVPSDAPHDIKAHKAGWFDNEQILQAEREAILEARQGQTFDFVLTHTCPFDWQPTELFLKGLDQSTIDNSMEKWLSIVRDSIHWRHFVFAHFHADMLIRPHVIMLYKQIYTFDDLAKDKVELPRSQDYFN